ncbi:MAG: ferredoxin [Methanoregula sp.]
MKVRIDRLTCVSCGSCWDACPGFFEQNPDDSFSQVREKFRLNGEIGSGVPSDEVIPCVRDAADLCPMQIISIEDD